MLTFKIEKDCDEFHAWIPELKGCHSHGKTVEQIKENLNKAMHLYLEIR